MSRITRPIPGLFGGVSQQIPAMRHPTQCEEQLNGLATLVDGLFKRTGTKHIRTLPLTGANGASVLGSDGSAFGHVIDKGGSSKFLLILVDGNLMLYDLLTGDPQTVSFPGGKGYLSTSSPEFNFRCVSVADYTFVVNRSKVVQDIAASDPVNPTNVAYINVRTAAPNVDYTVNIDSVAVTYTAGASPTNGGIVTNLLPALSTALGAGYTVSRIAGTNIIKVLKGSGSITCKVSDGWGNNCLQSLTDGVQKFADLPPAFETGYVVSITGTSESFRDTYFVKWDGARWVETKKPGIADTLDPATMPHQLRPDGSGGWVFEEVTVWDKRLVGDDRTNPMPSFVGHSLQDIFFFRNRLGVLSRDGLVMSRAGEYFSFFSRTATQVLDSDPIDLAVPTDQVNSLRWAVPFNENLLVDSDSKQQFMLVGGDILSPNNARLVPSTSFETYIGAKPEPFGNKVLFSSTKGSYSQLSLYRMSNDTVTKTADDITEHVPRYVPASPRQMAVSTVTRMAVVVPRGLSQTLAVFKWETDENEKMTQRCWGKFEFQTPGAVRIIKAHWDSRRLYLLLHVTVTGDTAVTGGRFVLEYFDFPMEGAEDLAKPEALRLDGQVAGSFVSSTGSTSQLEVPYLASSGLVAVRYAAGGEPTEVPILSYTLAPSSGTTLLTVQGNMTGATVYVGRPFKFRYRFTEVFMRDANGVPVMESRLKLIRMRVRCHLTGWFKALVTPLLRETYTYPFVGRTIGVPGQGASQLSLSSGDVNIPVGTSAGGCSIVLESDSYLPCCFPYAEWVGDVSMKAQR